MTFSTLATAVNLGGKHKSVEVEVKGGVCVVVDIFLLEYSKKRNKSGWGFVYDLEFIYENS
jgi:hypothetical protein